MTEPQNIMELVIEIADIIENHYRRIYVRECIAGKWDAYSLDQLDTTDMIKHICAFFRDFKTPAYLLEEQP